jgi:hypothetical protein
MSARAFLLLLLVDREGKKKKGRRCRKNVSFIAAPLRKSSRPGRAYNLKKPRASVRTKTEI